VQDAARSSLRKTAGASFAGRRSPSPSWAQRRHRRGGFLCLESERVGSRDHPLLRSNLRLIGAPELGDRWRCRGTDGESGPDPEWLRKRDQVGNGKAPAAETAGLSACAALRSSLWVRRYVGAIHFQTSCIVSSGDVLRLSSSGNYHAGIVDLGVPLSRALQTAPVVRELAVRIRCTALHPISARPGLASLAQRAGRK